MRISRHGLKAAITLATLFAFSTAAQAEFCSRYQQIHSNAGQCDNCFVTIKSFPSDQVYTATSSNGWYAELPWIEGDSSVASGTGIWVGAPKTDGFEIDLEQQGTNLNMTMQMYENKKRGHLISARFRCVE